MNICDMTYIFEGPRMLYKYKIAEAITVVRHTLEALKSPDAGEIQPGHNVLKRVMYDMPSWKTGVAPFINYNPDELVNEYVKTWDAHPTLKPWAFHKDPTNAARIIVTVDGRDMEDPALPAWLLSAGEWLGFGKLFNVGIIRISKTRDRNGRGSIHHKDR